MRFVVIGAGTMGTWIAYVAATSGYIVQLVEVDTSRAAAALGMAHNRWRREVSKGRLSQADAEMAETRLNTAPSLDLLSDRPDVVVEAVPEKLELKRSVLAEAAALEPDLLASNTSSISIGTLAAELPHPDRFCGLHFFNPVPRMPLLEIVLGPATSDATRRAALAVAAQLGKEPVVVADAPGFATSRLGVALALEAIRMVEAGVAAPADIDAAMRLGYGHPMGPLELTDLVGLDVRLDIARTLQAAYGDRFAPPELLTRMVTEGRLGTKTGKGFYRWRDGKKVA